MQNKKNTIDVNALARKNILGMKPYSSARDEFHGNAEVFLDANENPFPSPFNRYPDPQQRTVKAKLAEIKNVRADQIFLGNGSDEAIDLLIRIFCEPNRDSILVAEPTYGMYSVCAEVNAVTVKSVPLTARFDLNDQMLLTSIDATTKLIFLCSPNNPSGNLLSRDRIEKMLGHFRGIVVLDEAYIDFAKTRSFVEDLASYPNLVVLQTFSKAWGLAGLRLGVAYASAEIIALMNRVKYPYNVNTRTQEIALEVLDNPDYKDRCVSMILHQREKVVQALREAPIVENIYPSDSNFLLVRVRNAATTYQHLMENKIIVRDRSRVTLCDNCLRITIGTADENDQLIESLKQL
jgi:histidinol-phosphate aminotransferase